MPDVPASPPAMTSPSPLVGVGASQPFNIPATSPSPPPPFPNPLPNPNLPSSSCFPSGAAPPKKGSATSKLPTSEKTKENTQAPSKGIAPKVPASATQKKQRTHYFKAPPAQVAQTTRSWNDLFNGTSAVSHASSLIYTQPTLEDGLPVVEIEESDYESALDRWNLAVVGYVVGKIPVYTPFLQFLIRLWKPKGELKLYLRGNGFFIVKFLLEEDLKKVLEGGLWSMDNRPFILQRWSPSVRMEQERLTSIPIWIKFPHLPVHLWTKECLGKLASAVGTPLCLDTATQRGISISFARICVEIEANKCLPDSVCVNSKSGGREVFPIVYDWKPQACPHCHTFGHDGAMCSKKPLSLPSTDPIKNKELLPEKNQLPNSTPLSSNKGKEHIVQSNSMEDDFISPKKKANKFMSDAIKSQSSPSQKGNKKNSTSNLSNKFQILPSIQESSDTLQSTSSEDPEANKKESTCNIASEANYVNLKEQSTDHLAAQEQVNSGSDIEEQVGAPLEDDQEDIFPPSSMFVTPPSQNNGQHGAQMEDISLEVFLPFEETPLPGGPLAQTGHRKKKGRSSIATHSHQSQVDKAPLQPTLRKSKGANKGGSSNKGPQSVSKQ
ncbi:hypothetical protein QJS10_CPB22g00516 [Acorus calamus]|uniref:DUF4283 domain-containing protein n=1 Tax=Acorus calamus TaxID=4465 RepID=A0AAV9C2H8_ACOCL|nr:hypothetical protein QJS10_CPB22g00516 [Acorus calamus]